VSADDEARTTATFLRGLTIGALVGAVLAGSSMWSRRRHRATGRSTAPSVPDDPVVKPKNVVTPD
jgi:hypothetical protein